MQVIIQRVMVTAAASLLLDTASTTTTASCIIIDLMMNVLYGPYSPLINYIPYPQHYD